MQKLLFILLCCAALGFAPAVWAKGADAPKEAVQVYYDALFVNDYQAAYDSLSQSDKAALSLDAYMRENHFDYPMMRYVNSVSSYKTGKIKTDGAHGEAKVTIQAPDGEDVNTFVARTFTAYGMHGLSEDEALARLLELVKEHKFKMYEKEQDVMLVKDDEGWHVYFDWAYREARLQKMRDAQELSYSQHIEDLLRAEALFAEVRQMCGNENDMYFVNAIWAIKRKIEHLEACIGKIEVTDIAAGVVAGNPADVHVAYAYTLYNRNSDVINIAVVKVELHNADGSAVFTREERVPQRDVEQRKTIPVTKWHGRLPDVAAAVWDGTGVTVKVINVELY